MITTLPWFSGFPLYLAPMAGVSDKIFRQLCKKYGADVLTTEFVSAEGIFRRNERTCEYLDFDDIERPIGVQLFGADAGHMAEAARRVIDGRVRRAMRATPIGILSAKLPLLFRFRLSETAIFVALQTLQNDLVRQKFEAP